MHEIHEVIGNHGEMKLTSDENWRIDHTLGKKGEVLWKKWIEKFSHVYTSFLVDNKDCQQFEHIDIVIVSISNPLTDTVEVKTRTFMYLQYFAEDHLILLEIEDVKNNRKSGLMFSRAAIYGYGFFSEDEKELINPMFFDMAKIQFFLKNHQHEYKVERSKNSDTPFILVPYSILQNFRLNFFIEGK